MKKAAVILFLIFAISSFARSQSTNETIGFRPPSVPLITHDPYFSIWSPSDRLTDMETVHWTGTRNPIHSMIRIDGKTYRLMGGSPTYVEPMKQLSLKVLPTNTVYEFSAGGVKVSLIFTSPLLVKDMEVMSRPLTYLTWKIESDDKADHKIQLYFDCGSELSVNTNEQQVTWEQPAIKGLKTGKIGNPEQKYLNRSGDNLRIDWGYAYLSVPESKNLSFSIAPRKALADGFARTGAIPVSTATTEPVKVRDGSLTMAASWDLGTTGKNL